MNPRHALAHRGDVGRVWHRRCALSLFGKSPVATASEALYYKLETSFGVEDLGTLVTPLILTGLAAGVAMRVQLWNIDAEGQFI